MRCMTEQRAFQVGRSTVKIDVLCPESPGEIIGVLQMAGVQGKKVWPVGNLSKLGRLAAPRFNPEEYLFVSTVHYRGVTEYVPQNLCVVARAGTLVSDLMEQAKTRGQFCPALLFQPEGASLGGILAANEPHLLENSFGNIRQSVSGVRLFTGGGRLSFGGKNVKNVSGYEVSKFMVGSRGIFGIITDVTFFLKPFPEVTRAFLANVEEGMGEAGELENWFRQARRGLTSLVGCWGNKFLGGLEVVILLSGTKYQVEEESAGLGHYFSPLGEEEADNRLTALNARKQMAAMVVERAPGSAGGSEATGDRPAVVDLPEEGVWDLVRDEIYLPFVTGEYQYSENELAVKGLLRRVKKQLDPGGLFVGEDAYAD